MVVYVEPQSGSREMQTVEDERHLRATPQLADELGATVARLRGRVADELIAYARAHNVTHLVVVRRETAAAGRGAWGQARGAAGTAPVQERGATRVGRGHAVAGGPLPPARDNDRRW